MIRVGVIRGGTHEQYADSLASGAFVLKNLPRDRYQPVDIYIDQNGAWHIGGVEVSPKDIAGKVDVIWNSLHAPSDKKTAKDELAKLGVPTPPGMFVEEWGNEDRERTVMDTVRDVSTKLSPPWIVEAISRGRANGPMRAKTRDELAAILFQMYDADVPVLIEQAVLGTEASVIASSGFRGQPTYTFLPKRADNSRLGFKAKESQLLQAIAKKIHDGLGLGAYSRVHAVIDKRGKVSVLGVETTLMTHADADLHDALEAVGSSFHEFAHHLIAGTMQDK